MEKRSNFSSFPQYFQYISNFRSQITYTFVKCGCSIYFFLNSTNLICRSTDISKYFRESLGIRHNESRLFFLFVTNVVSLSVTLTKGLGRASSFTILLSASVFFLSAVATFWKPLMENRARKCCGFVAFGQKVRRLIMIFTDRKLQSNLNGSNIFGTMEIRDMGSSSHWG